MSVTMRHVGMHHVSVHHVSVHHVSVHRVHARALCMMRACAERLAAECGDELLVRGYRRLSPLTVLSSSLGSASALQPGDCLVAFSRRAVHGLKREVLRRRCGGARCSAWAREGGAAEKVRRRA
eukprot:212768-Chlamydomonas_euryale.AAC.1